MERSAGSQVAPADGDGLPWDRVTPDPETLDLFGLDPDAGCGKASCLECYPDDPPASDKPPDGTA